ALSVTDVPLYRNTYAPLLMEPILAPSPDAYLRDPAHDAEMHARLRLDDMRGLLERHADEVAAIVVEPLVQCARGMRMHHPAFLCLSKGLTGGTLPLSAVLTRERIHAAFYAEYASGKAFLHSHSYTGNPLACRAALETLAIFRDEPVLERNRMLAAHLHKRLAV